MLYLASSNSNYKCRCVFITFEGIDGSGKSTQIKLLEKRLDNEGRKVTVFRDPGGTVVSEKIRNILLNPESEIDPVTELLLFSAARSQLIAEKVLPLLEQGYTVILDRFYDSTIAYQGYGRNSVALERIHQLNRVASHNREPDLTFYLQISLEQAKKRTATKRKDRMEQAGDEFYQKVIEGFDKLAEKEERFIALDATLPEDHIHRQIWEKVSDSFTNP